MCPYRTPMCPIMPCSACRRADEAAKQAELDRRVHARTGKSMLQLLERERQAHDATGCSYHPGLTKGYCGCTA